MCQYKCGNADARRYLDNKDIRAMRNGKAGGSIVILSLYGNREFEIVGNCCGGRISFRERRRTYERKMKA